MATHFNVSDFIANGPTILTRICDDICDTNQRSKWTRQTCRGLELKPKENFHPLAWQHYMMYFDANKLNETMELVKNTAMVHVWNDRSRLVWNKVGTNNAYQVIGARNCPLVYGSSEFFWNERTIRNHRSTTGKTYWFAINTFQLKLHWLW